MPYAFQRIFNFHTHVDLSTRYWPGTAVGGDADDRGICFGACVVWCQNVLHNVGGQITDTDPDQQRAATIQQLFEWPRPGPGVHRPFAEERAIRTLSNQSLRVSVYPQPVAIPMGTNWGDRPFQSVLERLSRGPDGLYMLLLQLGNNGGGHSVALLKAGDTHYYMFDPMDGVGLIYWASALEMRTDFMVRGLLGYRTSRAILLTFVQ